MNFFLGCWLHDQDARHTYMVKTLQKSPEPVDRFPRNFVSSHDLGLQPIIACSNDPWLSLTYFTAVKFCFGLVLSRLNVPVNNFSVMSGQIHRFLGITCTFPGVNVTAPGHNTVEVGIEPPTSRSRSEALLLGHPFP